ELTLFPDQKAIMDVALHFSQYIRDNEATFLPDELNNNKQTPLMFEQRVKILHDRYAMDWSKQYREGTITATMNELIELLRSWEMLKLEKETNSYLIRPLLGRVVGKYPMKFIEETEAD